ALTAVITLIACGGGSKSTSQGAGSSATAAPASAAQATAAPAATVAPKKLTFMAGFKPQANLPLVGVYVAAGKGFFRENAIDVDIQHDQTGAQNLQLLLAGQIQVTTANGAQVIQRNADNLPLVSLALVGQKSEQGFAVGASSGINSVADWAGKTFG